MHSLELGVSSRKVERKVGGDVVWKVESPVRGVGESFAHAPVRAALSACRQGFIETTIRSTTIERYRANIDARSLAINKRHVLNKDERKKE